MVQAAKHGPRFDAPEGVDLSLSETHTRMYWWCSPPKIGMGSMRPTAWTARGIGASLYNDKWVRASL